jgi:pimeloyl-ACP methyl ester carboxylesterase/putative sterol carrier protein
MSSKPPERASSGEIIRERVRTLPRRFRRESANGLVAEWELRIGSQAFAVSIVDHGCYVREGPSASPQTIIEAEPATWLAFDEGRLDGSRAFLERTVTVTGNLDLAVRLQILFKPYKRARKATDIDQVDIQADGVNLSCYVLGSGPAILLIHGLGASKISWLPILPPLAERYRVIVPDLPGHGESEKLRTDYSPRFYAKVLRHLLDRVEVEQAMAVGNSMGGRIAVEMALRSPGRVSALGLVAPAVPGVRMRYLMGFTRVLPTEFGAIPFPLRERWTELILRRLFANPGFLNDAALHAASGEFIRIYKDPVARMAFFSSLRHLLTERPEPFFSTLRRIKQPTVVILGEHDRLVPPKLGVRLAARMRDADLVVLPNVGHVPQFEATDQTLLALLELADSALPGKNGR